MSRKIFFPIFIFIVLAGCTNYLVYRSDFQDNQIAYYTDCLATEENIQKESMEKIENKVQKLSELCYVLYHRFPTHHGKYAVSEANLKLARLNKAVKTLQSMRQKFYHGFKLILTREDWVVGPLQLQCDLEIQYMSSFIDELNEARARVAYLAKFRQQCLLTNELPEEKLEGVDVDLFRLEKEIADIIYRQVPEYLTNVGIAITNDEDFKFDLVKPVELKQEADKEAEAGMLAAGNKDLLNDASGYEYEFLREREEFDLAFQELKASIDRFRTTIDAYSEHTQKTKSSNSMEITLAEQSRQITTIMEQSANRIKSLFDESMSDINKLVGTELEVVDEKLWPKLRTGTEEELKKADEKSYHDNVLELNSEFEKMFNIDITTSDSAQLRNNLVTFGKGLQEKKGLWGPGYKFLNAEWQEKISINRLDNLLTSKLKELENYAAQAVRPLWKTSATRLIKEGKDPGYKPDAKGFLKPDQK